MESVLKEEAKKTAAIETIRAMKKRSTSSIIPRTKVPEFTNGLFSVGHLANCDSRGEGPEGGFRIGRQKCYPVDALVEWLIKRVEV